MHNPCSVQACSGTSSVRLHARQDRTSPVAAPRCVQGFLTGRRESKDVVPSPQQARKLASVSHRWQLRHLPHRHGLGMAHTGVRVTVAGRFVQYPASVTSGMTLTPVQSKSSGARRYVLKLDEPMENSQYPPGL